MIHINKQKYLLPLTNMPVNQMHAINNTGVVETVKSVVVVARKL
jgi:hypothetical protein